MSVANVMRKTLQLARHQLGMPAARAFCDHEFEPTFANRRTFQVTERRCTKCGLRQRAETTTVWRDVKEA